MIASLEAERDIIAEDKASTHVNAEKIQALHKLKAIGRSLPRCWLARYSIVTSTIAATGELCRLRAEPFQSGNVAHDQGISKAGNHKGRPSGSNSPGCGCAISRQRFERLVRARVGTVKGRIRQSPSWRWRASCWWRYGVILKLAWCRGVPSQGVITGAYEIQGGCVTGFRHGWKTPR